VSIVEINKINANAINTYKTIKKSEKSGAGKQPSGKFDSVVIDFSQSINSAKANIASRLDAQANIEKIRQLQEQYSGDKCPVPAEETAKSIVGE
jgi:hypothetical protein